MSYQAWSNQDRAAFAPYRRTRAAMWAKLMREHASECFTRSLQLAAMGAPLESMLAELGMARVDMAHADRHERIAAGDDTAWSA